MRYLFGPVASRRYGRSLGVDLALPKSCTLNCRFCQLGATAQTTVTRTSEPPIDAVLDELRAWFAADTSEVDFVTASGSGEPTLHRHFGDVIRFTHGETPCRALLLTNGTLLSDPDVRVDAALADVVKVSLHAWDQASFEQITRPHPSLRFGSIIDGYRAFRDTFAGQLDLEIFIIPGINDTSAQVAAIAALAQQFRPDSVTLNTAVRPPADGDVAVCPPERLRELSVAFGQKAAIGGAEPERACAALTEETVVALVSRHPVSVKALAVTFGKDEASMLAYLRPLEQRARLGLYETRGACFAGPPQHG